jgi:hypothetical protein
MGGPSHGSWCKHIPQRTAIVVSQDDARLRSTALIAKAWDDKIEAASGHRARSSLPSRVCAAENSQTAISINCGDSHNPVPGPSEFGMTAVFARFLVLSLRLLTLILGQESRRIRHRTARHELLLISSPLLARVPAFLRSWCSARSWWKSNTAVSLSLFRSL